MIIVSLIVYQVNIRYNKSYIVRLNNPIYILLDNIPPEGSFHISYIYY